MERDVRARLDTVAVAVFSDGGAICFLWKTVSKMTGGDDVWRLFFALIFLSGDSLPGGVKGAVVHTFFFIPFRV